MDMILKQDNLIINIKDNLNFEIDKIKYIKDKIKFLKLDKNQKVLY